MRRFIWSAGTTSARGIALFLGAFTMTNILGSLVIPTFDANIWWIDITTLTPYAETPLLAGIGIALIAFALRPLMKPWRRNATLAAIGVAIAAAAINTVGYYRLAASDQFAPGFILPFSLLVVLALAGIAAVVLHPSEHAANTSPWRLAFAVLACVILFPLLQMLCFGTSDYSRPADAIVVLGAKAYANGAPSVPLADRVRTACDLYRRHLAPVLIFSGGDGDGNIHETESMRNMAIRLGVPESAILLDRNGVNTQATVENTVPMFRSLGARRVMVVSHAYHLPRVKMAYQRAGWNVYTVPARESYTLTAIPFYVAREVAGIWAYYAEALWR
ncbi:MAG: YdcF family protein [Bacteroidetes bacterium]|nr:YdcF family protein [Bacteroidota bacterium]